MMQAAAGASPVVFVVDDDFDVREVLKSLLESLGLRAEVFGSTREFLQHKPKDTVSCLVLDVSLPGMSGLDFQAELSGTHANIPIIFLSGHGDERMSVKAMKAGAVDFSPSRCASRICSMPSTWLSNVTAPDARMRRWHVCSGLSDRERGKRCHRSSPGC